MSFSSLSLLDPLFELHNRFLNVNTLDHGVIIVKNDDCPDTINLLIFLFSSGREEKPAKTLVSGGEKYNK